MILLYTLAALAVAIAGDVYDVTLTSRGLKAGVALESNTFLIGSKPSTRVLYLRDALILAFCMIPAEFALIVHNVPIFYGALAAPVAYGVKHFLGGLAWRKLLKK